MVLPIEPVFENRRDAGKKLAALLTGYRKEISVVLAIPNGGVPVAVEVSKVLDADLDLVISRKIPIPLNPEAGFGAITNDGTMILNEDLVKKIGLRRWQIDHEAGKVRTDIKHRMLLYRGDRPLPIISGRSVIIIDDGLASGITMTAAVESMRHRRPKHIFVGVPCASAIAVKQLERIADKVITCSIGYMPRFAVADYYRYWYDVDDEEVVNFLKQWQVRQFWSNNESS